MTFHAHGHSYDTMHLLTRFLAARLATDGRCVAAIYQQTIGKTRVNDHIAICSQNFSGLLI